MSLKRFVALPAVRERLNPLLAGIQRPKKPLLLVAPSKGEQSRAGRIGTAFDYLLRFELGRHYHHALEEQWVAYAGAAALPRELFTEDGSLFPWDAAAAALHEADQVVRAYRQNPAPDARAVCEVARVALVLAQLDPFYRAGFNPFWWRANFARPPADEVNELVALLAATPLALLHSQRTVLLNPTFGRHSRAVGGADADLVLDDMLLDIKTGQECAVRLQDLRQLAGYFLLSRAMRLDDPQFPELIRLGILSPRFGSLWTFPVTVLCKHPLFEQTEQWWRSRLAAERYPPQLMGGAAVRDMLHRSSWEVPPPARRYESLLSRVDTERILLDRAIASARHAAAESYWVAPAGKWGPVREVLVQALDKVLRSRKKRPAERMALPGWEEPAEVWRPERGVLVIDLPLKGLFGGQVAPERRAVEALGGHRVRLAPSAQAAWGRGAWRIALAAPAERVADALLFLSEAAGASAPKPRRAARQKTSLARTRGRVGK